MSGPKMNVNVAGVEMRTPLVLASGTCGFGRELSEMIDLSGVGAICSKGLTLHPSRGNAGTRVWETPSGMINSIGLENPGVERFIADELPFMRTLGTAVIVNLGGHSVDDYLRGLELLDGESFDMLELNISCPNVKSGGMSFGATEGAAREIVRLARAACRHRMSVKLTPNAGDIVAVARACEEEGADALTVANTFLGMAIDVYARRPVFDNVYAGLSGPAVRPIALRIVHQAARAVKIPIMACGGVASWRDAVEYIMAGASAVQIGTATFADPASAIKAAGDLSRFMDEQGIGSIDEIRGAAL